MIGWCWEADMCSDMIGWRWEADMCSDMIGWRREAEVCSDMKLFKLVWSKVVQLVANFSLQRSGFNPRPVHVGFVVVTVALGQIFFWMIWFTLSVSFHVSPVLWCQELTARITNMLRASWHVSVSVSSNWTLSLQQVLEWVMAQNGTSGYAFSFRALAYYTVLVLNCYWHQTGTQ
jgi:hypothetical protein